MYRSIASNNVLFLITQISLDVLQNEVCGYLTNNEIQSLLFTNKQIFQLVALFHQVVINHKTISFLFFYNSLLNKSIINLKLKTLIIDSHNSPNNNKPNSQIVLGHQTANHIIAHRYNPTDICKHLNQIHHINILWPLQLQQLHLYQLWYDKDLCYCNLPQTTIKLQFTKCRITHFPHHLKSLQSLEMIDCEVKTQFSNC